MQLLSPSFLSLIQQIARRAPQAILLEGVHGHGAQYEAEMLAQELVKQSGGNARSMAKPEGKQVITIEQIQSLYRETRSKQPTGLSVWIIQEAEQMSESAQNAFLKLLEEPPVSVVFILATSGKQGLLQTIQSRCKVVTCAPFSAETATNWLKEHLGEQSSAQQLVFLAEGSSSELVRLTEDEDYRKAQLEATKEAKLLISGTTFDQITLVSQLAGDRARALKTTHIALQMLTMLAPQQADQKNYAKRLDKLVGAYEHLLQNGNVRLQLLRFITCCIT